ncbi:hypothetical protein ANTHELSMS3_00254 [Antarctobacter heliothermus]|uniref:Uncharacterized protein n=1 Tax=Antarctobacter heliothermus TaxID=74033 RepID=A0A222DYE4_9RHOB|nr:hypothetical protein [Antarctobacter heliothermus]ASP18979.1 hypothetical protein ANTHELSMS3_00254 [Antarctobacter heliothermus]MBT54222.1 hypothetical protein [Mameliella sp.]
MYILEGAVVIVAAVALYVWARALHHRETAPNWARRQVFASAVGLVLVCVAPAGVGLLTYGLGQPMTRTSWIGVAGLAVAPAVLWRGTRS